MGSQAPTRLTKSVANRKTRPKVGIKESHPWTLPLSWESLGCCPCSNLSTSTSTYQSLLERRSQSTPMSGCIAAHMAARRNWPPESARPSTSTSPTTRYLLTTICRYVDYALNRIRLMRHHKVEPFLVFDGGPLPAKRGTEEDRAKSVVKVLVRLMLTNATGNDRRPKPEATRLLVKDGTVTRGTAM